MNYEDQESREKPLAALSSYWVRDVLIGLYNSPKVGQGFVIQALYIVHCAYALHVSSLKCSFGEEIYFVLKTVFSKLNLFESL